MPKFPTIPRLSIIVPLGADLAAFEDSLVSVLASAPAGVEVIVPHDGSYDDPFDLGDEVRFLTAPSHELVTLLTNSLEQARGQYIHVLAGGVKATDGWIDAGMQAFDQGDVASVAPVVQGATGKVLSAGWSDTPTRLCCPSEAGADGSFARTGGVFLNACFFRRDVLRSLLDAIDLVDETEVTYALGLLMRQAGWTAQVASKCQLVIEDSSGALSLESRLGIEPSYTRGQSLEAVRQALGRRPAGAISTVLTGVLSNLFHPGLALESLGRLSAGRHVAVAKSRIDPDSVKPYGQEHGSLSMSVKAPRRKAA